MAVSAASTGAGWQAPGRVPVFRTGRITRRAGPRAGRGRNAVSGLALGLILAVLATGAPSAAPPPDDLDAGSLNLGQEDAVSAARPGPVVRHIRLQRDPIFSEADKRRLPWLPLGLVNLLHIDTRPSVIRRELLFAEGERISAEELVESERKLRRSGFFSRANVVVVPVATDSVDVYVQTQELWTTAFNFAYERFEEQLIWKVQLRERNFLGSARSFEVSRDVDVDRDSWTFGVGDRQLLGGKWDGRLYWRDASDGSTTAWSLARPFFRITDDWALFTDYTNGTQAPRFYLTSTLYVRPPGDFTKFETYGLHKFAQDENRVWRAGLGVRVDRTGLNTDQPLELSDARGSIDSLISLGPEPRENRRLNIPMLVLAVATLRYEEMRRLFAMGNVEDIPLGSELLLKAGWSTHALGSSDDGIWYELGYSWFRRTGPRLVLRTRIRSGGLLTNDEVENLRLTAEMAGYRRLNRSMTLALGVVGATGDNVDRHRLFSLGLDSGLRASRFRELSGDRMLRGNVELRWIPRSGILGLFSPGAAAFADVGSAWLEEETDFAWSNFRGAIGFGLRLGITRAATDEPIRVDLAWPILYPTDQPSPVLSIGTGQVF